MDIQMKKVANDSVVLIELLIIFAIGFVSGVHWAARTTLPELGVWARIHPLCNLNTLQF